MQQPKWASGALWLGKQVSLISLHTRWIHLHNLFNITKLERWSEQTEREAEWRNGYKYKEVPQGSCGGSDEQFVSWLWWRLQKFIQGKILHRTAQAHTYTHIQINARFSLKRWKMNKDHCWVTIIHEASFLVLMLCYSYIKYHHWEKLGKGYTRLGIIS